MRVLEVMRTSAGNPSDEELKHGYGALLFAAVWEEVGLPPIWQVPDDDAVATFSEASEARAVVRRVADFAEEFPRLDEA